MKKHEELIRLSENGEISQSVQNLKKANDKVILKIYSEYEVIQAEKANVFLTYLLISKLLDAIENSEELGKELQNDKLLKNDVKSVVERLMPFFTLSWNIEWWSYCWKTCGKAKGEEVEKHDEEGEK